MRADLPRGFLAAQVTHAAGESVGMLSGGLLEALRSGMNAVCLAARDEAELRRVHERLTAADVPHKLVIETDPPYAGQATAIGLVYDRAIAKKCLSSLPLLR